MQLKEIYEIPKRNKGNPKPHIGSQAEYEKQWKESVEHPNEYWARAARENLDWIIPFKTTMQGVFQRGDLAWFPEGYLNVSYNCVDRHAAVDPDRVAIIYEADEPGNSQKITYGELLAQVCKLANALKSFGIQKGDSVAIYLPMIVEAVVTFLACARIGAVHSVIFAGFSAESLRDRIIDANSRIVITTDEGRRGGKTIATKNIVDAALRECGSVERVLVFKRTGNEVPMTKGRDLWWHDEIAKHKPYCAPEIVNSEDPLFLLYTSGSTGKPKGVMHTSAGYLLGAHLTVKYVFDVHPGDIFACMADIGWITGHTYIVYGPLCNGVTTLVFESTPVYPDASRYWKCVQEHKITQFYTAPTAIRLLRRMGDDYVKGHDLSSIRVLGSVGEPINPEAWGWYSEVVGKGECAVVDTMWQTETGCHIITPLPSAHKTKPGSASFPFFGIEVAILDPTSGKELEGNDVEGVLAVKKPWPSMARTVAGDHQRFLDTYLKPYPGYYFTGDGAARDKDGYIWIRGRVDDVINVSGHRLSTAEIESALVAYKGVAEVAVIAAPDELTGQTVHAFVAMKPDAKTTDEESLKKELTLQVRRVIGPFAAPRTINLLAGDDLPKTRSGKIMRRVLRKISSNELDTLGDTSTLADPSVVERLIEIVKKNQKK